MTHPHLKALLFAALCTLSTLAVATPTQTAHAELVDRIVAKVNSQIITLNDLKRASGPYLLAYNIDVRTLPQRKDRDKVYNQVLQDMINTQLLVQEADETQLEITDGEVTKWISNISQQQGLSESQFRAALRERSVRWQDYRRYVHDNLLKYRLIQIKLGSRIKITKDQLHRAYRDQFDADPTKGALVAELSHLYIPYPDDATPEDRTKTDALAETLHKRLVAGEDFRTIAKEHSQGPTAESGGYLGEYKPGTLPKASDDVVFANNEARITPIIKASSGLTIFKVHSIETKVDPATQQRLDQLRLKLREQELNKRLDSWMEELRQGAFIRVLY